jgi:hypothetical protein
MRWDCDIQCDRKAGTMRARKVVMVLIMGAVVGGVVWETTVLAQSTRDAGDQARVDMYLHAYHSQEIVEQAGLSAIRTAVDRYADAEVNRCHRAGADGEKSGVVKEIPAETVFSQEAVDAVVLTAVQEVWLVEIRRDRPATEIVDRTHWADPYLSRLERLAQNERHAWMTLGMPELCADEEALATGDVETGEKHAEAFVRRWQAIEEEASGQALNRNVRVVARTPISRLILRGLARYERDGERRFAKNVEEREARLGQALAGIILDADAKMREGLGL